LGYQIALSLDNIAVAYEGRVAISKAEVKWPLAEYFYQRMISKIILLLLKIR
jgi:hypothetical protein